MTLIKNNQLPKNLPVSYGEPLLKRATSLTKGSTYGVIEWAGKWRW